MTRRPTLAQLLEKAFKRNAGLRLTATEVKRLWKALQRTTR